jgi:hypothetical protein
LPSAADPDRALVRVLFLILPPPGLLADVPAPAEAKDEDEAEGDLVVHAMYIPGTFSSPNTIHTSCRPDEPVEKCVEREKK